MKSAVASSEGFMTLRLSDYAPLQFEAVIKPGEESISTKFYTNRDKILEMPSDDYTTLQVNLRGMFASQLGRLTTTVDILGSSDDRSTHYQLLVAEHHHANTS